MQTKPESNRRQSNVSFQKLPSTLLVTKTFQVLHTRTGVEKHYFLVRLYKSRFHQLFQCGQTRCAFWSAKDSLASANLARRGNQLFVSHGHCRAARGTNRIKY